MCSAREEAGLGHLVASCPSQGTARRPWGCHLAQGLPLCSVSQPSPAPQELSEQPGPTSPLGGLPGGRAQEAPTASQGLLRLFQRNTPVEDLGAKGVSPDGAPPPCRPGRQGRERGWRLRPVGDPAQCQGHPA